MIHQRSQNQNPDVQRSLAHKIAVGEMWLRPEERLSPATESENPALRMRLDDVVIDPRRLVAIEEFLAGNLYWECVGRQRDCDTWLSHLGSACNMSGLSWQRM